MASLETLGLANGGKLEVEVYFTIEVLVPGKGAGYNQKVEVGPEEVMDVIEQRVSFFRIFRMRGFEIYAPEVDRIFDSADMNTLMFRDSLLKNGSKLVLCEPAKNKVSDDEEEEDDDEQVDDVSVVEAEGGEDEMMEEGGEDEQEEINPDAAENDESDGEEDAGDEDDNDDNEAAAMEEDEEEGEGEDADDGDGDKGAPLGFGFGASR